MSNTYTDEYRGYGTVAPTCLPSAEGNKISGICIPYNKSAYIGKHIFEAVKPGALTELLKSNPKVGCIIEHDPLTLLGSSKCNLKLWDSTEGLRYSCTLPDTTYAKDLIAVMEANPGLYGASFMMRLSPKDYVITKMPTGNYLRTIHTISKLIEITITAFAVYTATTADLGEAVKATGDGGERAKGLLQYWKIRERAAAIV